MARRSPSDSRKTSSSHSSATNLGIVPCACRILPPMSPTARTSRSRGRSHPFHSQAVPCNKTPKLLLQAVMSTCDFSAPPSVSEMGPQELVCEDGGRGHSIGETHRVTPFSKSVITISNRCVYLAQEGLATESRALGNRAPRTQHPRHQSETLAMAGLMNLTASFKGDPKVPFKCNFDSVFPHWIIERVAHESRWWDCQC